MLWTRDHGTALWAFMFLLAASASDARQCKIGCHGTQGNLLKFEAGKVYNYKLEGSSVTNIPGATGEASKLDISASVQLAALTSCEHALKVTNVQITGPDGKKYALDKLSQGPIKFGLENGRIDSELCTEDAEDAPSLNIKRAVLSLLQSSVLKETGYATQSETDVFGTCPTGFEFTKSGNSLNVIRTRDLSKCAHREDISHPFLSTPYYLQSDIQSMPIADSSYRSTQKIEEGCLKTAELEEVYNFRAASAGPSTTKVSIRTKLTLTSPAPGTIPVTGNAARSIIFDQEHEQEADGVAARIVSLVQKACESRVVGKDDAKTFSELVRTLSGAKKQEIATALQQVKGGAAKDTETATRMILDGLVFAQSPSSVEVMADLLKKKEVTGNTARAWLLAIGSVRHASRAALTAVLPLLDGEPDVNAYLGIGSLAGKFCQEHECDEVNEVNQLQIKLGAPLLKGCKSASKREEDQLIASLKGLGNVHYLGPKIAGKIAECAQDKAVRPRIRSQALDTIRSDPHKDELKTLAINILKDVNEDSEIRIKAYLVLAECPCGKVAAVVKELLEKEESYQVGGFIVSHLRNLRASTNPDKERARQYLGSLIIPSGKFPIDPRKYSINSELSYSLDLLNTGAAGEANVIYSQKSWLPRAVSLNLTTQIFGTAYNVLEIDARAENLERVAERIFGPRGYLRNNKPRDIFEDGRLVTSNLLEKIARRYDQSVRPKRSLSRNDLDAVANKVKHDAVADDIDVDLSVKILGSELIWQKVHGSDAAGLSPERLIDDYFGSFDQLISKAKSIDIDYRRHAALIDKVVTYPTGLGLALRLKAVAAAAVRIKVDGKLDIPAILRNPKNADVRFQLIPSAAINAASEVTIDGVAIEAGTRVEVNIHTSTGSDLTLRVLDGRGVDVKLGLPLPAQEIASVQSSFLSVVRDDAQQVTTNNIKFNSKRESYQGCFDQLNPIIGLTVCGEVSVPWENGGPIHPLLGPSNLNVRIDKDDPSLSVYHFRAFYDHKEDSHARSFEVLLDTPGSKTSRKLSLSVEGSIQEPKRYLLINANSPWTNLVLDSNVIDTNKEKSINAKLIHDGTEYVLRAGLSVDQAGNKVRYTPIFEYKAPEGSRSALIGKKGAAKSKQQAIATSGSVTDEGNGVFNIQALSISTPRSKYTVDGTVGVHKTDANVDLKVTYDKEHVTIKGAAKSQPGAVHLSLEVAPTQFPDVGFNLQWDASDNKQTGVYDNKLVIVHGPDPKSTVSRIFLHTKYEKLMVNGQIQSFGILHEVSYPVFQVEGFVNLRWTPNSLNGAVQGKVDKYSAKLSGSGTINKKQPGDYAVVIEAELMGNEIHLKSSRVVKKPNVSQFSNALILKPGGTYQLDAKVNHKVSSNDVDLQVDADVTVPNQGKIKLIGGVSDNPTKASGKLKAVIGDKVLVDGEGQLTKGGTPNGSGRLSVPGYLETTGNLANDGTNVKGSASLRLPKIDRTLEAKADLTTKAPKYAGLVSLCWDTKDPSKTIKIQTDTSVSDGALDSKNTVTFKDKVTQVNAKGKVAGSSSQGSTTGDVEVVLPDGHKTGVKYQESRNLETPNREGEVIVEIRDQAPGSGERWVKVSAVGKNINLEKGTVDGQAALAYKTPEGKDVNIHANLKKSPATTKDDGKTIWNINSEIGASGSLIEKPLSLKLESEVSNGWLAVEDVSSSMELDLPHLTYHLTGAIGSEVGLDSNGKVGGSLISGETSLRLPQSSQLKSIKWVTNNNIDLDDKVKIKSNNALHWNDKFKRILVEGQSEANGAQFAAEYESESVSKRRLTGNAHYSTGDNERADASVALNWEGKSADLSVKGEVNKDRTVASVHIFANTPEQGKIDVLLKNKIVKQGRGLHSDLTVTSKGKKVTANGKVELDPDHPLVEINVDHPDGKSRLLWKIDKKGDKHYAGEVKAKWTANGGGSLSFDSESNLASVDNFFVKMNADSPQLNLKKWHLDVANRPAKGDGKRIQFSIKAEDKVIASGSSNYNLKEEGDVAVLEGSGNIKIEEQTYPLTFQATKQRLENGRVGKINVKAGKYSVNWEGKVTPDEYHFERVYCQDQKCSKALLSAKSKRRGLEEEEHNVNVIVDLSLFNPKLHDIIYKSNYKRTNLLVDHDVEVQWAQDSKIKYNAYVHNDQIGVTLALPKRTIAAEAKIDVASKDSTAILKLEADLHLNKGKEPKICLIVGGSTSYQQGAASLAGEAKLTHPSLNRDLVARGQLSLSDKPAKLAEGALEVDISPDPNYKLIAKWKLGGSKDNLHNIISLKSKGCGIDITYEEKVRLVINGRESAYTYSEQLTYLDASKVKRELVGKLDISSKKITALVKLPDIVVLESEFKTDKGYSGSATVCGRKYQDSLTYNKDSKVAKYSVTGIDGKTLSVEAGGKLGGSGVLKLALDNKNAGQLDVALDETNFLQSKYNWDTEVAKSIWGALTNEAKILSKESERVLRSLLERGNAESKRLAECVGKATPDLTGLGNHVTEQLKAIKNELAADKALSDASTVLKDATGQLGEQIASIAEELVKFVQTLSKLLCESAEALRSAYNDLSPQLSQSLQNVYRAVSSVLEETLNLSVRLVNLALDQVKQHEQDIKEVLNGVLQVAQEIGKALGKVVVTLNAQLEEIIQNNLQQIQDVPIIATIKEKLEELKAVQIPDEVWNVYHELVEGLKQLLPTAEGLQFIDTASKLLEKVLKHEPIPNKDEAIKELYKEFVAAIKSIINLLGETIPKSGLLTPASVSPWSWNGLWRLPSGGIRVSLINLITNRDLPSVYELVSLLTPSLNPLRNIPPFRGHGVIVGGSEVITFDGRHLAIPGSCTYILSEDYVNRNFSIVGRIKGEALESITVFTGQQSVEIRPNSVALKDGKEVDLPASTGDLHVVRKPASINIYSDAGVSVRCTLKLDGCIVGVSGYYFGRVRGLLGNLNNEVYDERKSPEGKLAVDNNEFANSWRVDGSCAALPPAPEHKHSRESVCTEFFTAEPAAILCNPWVRSSVFRDACDHLVKRSSDKQAAACLASQAYVARCRQEGVLLAEIPEQCVTCTINNQKVKSGESVSVKPSGAADIVLVVELLKDNEVNYKQLAVPLVNELKGQLAKKGINDLHVTVVGANSPTARGWPVWYTSKGQITQDTLGSPLTFEQRPELSNETLIDRLETIFHHIFLETGSGGRGKAYVDVITNYQFRPNAHKFIIGVHGKSCNPLFGPGTLIHTIWGGVQLELQGIVYNLISPTEELEKDGKSVDAAVITKESVLTADGKEVDTEYDGIDACVFVSLETGGTTVSSDTFAKADGAKRATIIQRAADSIIKSLPQTEKPLECECSALEGLLPSPDCTVVDCKSPWSLLNM